MLINLSNHSSELWNEKQLQAALKKYDLIVDLTFPNISPDATKKNVYTKASLYVKKCIDLIKNSNSNKNAVHVMGELTFTYMLVSLLKKKNIKCIASTSNRDVIDLVNKKISHFDFVKFREY